MGDAAVVRMAGLQAELATARDRIAMLEEQLRNLADNDPITDLRNRRSFEQDLDDHLIAARRYGPEGVLILLRLEGMGAIDRATADTRRVTAASQVVARLRSTDVVAQWDTDTIAVLLPRSGGDHAGLVAETLLSILKRAGIAARAGVAVLRGDDTIEMAATRALTDSRAVPA